MSKIIKDSEEIVTNYCNSILALYRTIWSFITSIIALIYIHWTITIVIIVFSFAAIKIPNLFINRKTIAEEKYIIANNQYTGTVNEGLKSIVVSKVFHVKNDFLSKHFEKNEQCLKQKKAKDIVDLNVSFLSMSITQISFIAITIVGVILTIYDISSIGAVLSATQLIGGIMFPFEQIPGNILSIKVGKKMLVQYITLTENSKNIVEHEKTDSDENNKIVVDYMSFSYDEKVIFDDASVSLDMNKKYLVIGESGTGKSTLAKLLTQQFKPNEGMFRICSIDIENMSEEKLYDFISYQGQNTMLYNDSISYNICLGRKIQNDMLEEIVKAAKLQKLTEESEFGLQTIIGDDGNKISSGEAQRIGFARSLVNPSKFIIFDETTMGK